jgi:hypothetical protein
MPRRSWGRSIGGAALALLLHPAAAAAQGVAERSPLPPALRAYLAADTLPGLWREGGNAAGLGKLGLVGGGRVFGEFRQEDGDFRRPQRPAGTAALTVGMDGAREAAGWTAVGRFAYTRRQDRDVRWSIVADPYAGWPYVWADQRGGDWRRDGADLQAAVASPARGRLGGGLRVDYGVAQGARRNDPRPLFRQRDLRIAPGARVALGGGRELGLDGWAAWTREENEVGYFAGDDPVVYQLRGHGFFSRTTLVRSVRTVDGRERGAGVQMANAAARRPWSLAVRGFVGDDSARVNIARPEFGGGYRRVGGEARGALRLPGHRVSLEAALAGGFATGEGTDPFVTPRSINTLDADRHLLLTLSGWQGVVAADSRHAVGLQLGLSDTRREDVIVATDWHVLAALAGASAAARRRWGADAAVFAGAEAGVRTAISSRFEALRPTELTPVLVEPDFLFHAGHRVEGAFSAGTEFPIDVHSRARASLRVAALHAPAFETGSGRYSATLCFEMIR